jgi:hypothetical protein
MQPMENLIGGTDGGSPEVDCGSRSTSGPRGSLRKQLCGRRRMAESCRRRAHLLGRNEWGGPPLNASAGDCPHGWQHDMK